MAPSRCEYTEYEESLVRQANLNSRYDCLPTTNKLLSQLHLGIVAPLRRCQGEISEEIYKLVFPLFILILIPKTPKIWERCIHVPFNLLFLTASIYVFATKVKIL